MVPFDKTDISGIVLIGTVLGLSILPLNAHPSAPLRSKILYRYWPACRWPPVVSMVLNGARILPGWLWVFDVG